MSQFEAALIPEAELFIDYPSQDLLKYLDRSFFPYLRSFLKILFKRLDNMDDIRRVLNDSASTVRLTVETKRIRIEIFLPQLYPLVGAPEFQIFSDELSISALKRIRKLVADQANLTKIGGLNTGQGVLLEQINIILDAAHNAE